MPEYTDGRDGRAKISCYRCGYTVAVDGNIENMLSQFWLHLTFEHEGPVETIGVSNLDRISPSGIRLAIQIVVMPK